MNRRSFIKTIRAIAVALNAMMIINILTDKSWSMAGQPPVVRVAVIVGLLVFIGVAWVTLSPPKKEDKPE